MLIFIFWFGTRRRVKGELRGEVIYDSETWCDRCKCLVCLDEPLVSIGDRALKFVFLFGGELTQT